MQISFVVPRRPIPQARPRVVQNGRRTYTPRRSVEYREAVALCAKAAMQGKAPFGLPCSVIVQATFAVPKSWTRGKRLAARYGMYPHTSRPDLDNLYKAVTDAMIGIVYNDDAQIVSAHIDKKYGDQEGVRVVVEEEPDMNKVFVKEAGQ